MFAIPRARAPQARHDLDQVVPVLMARSGRQRDQRHRDRRRKRGARHPRHDFGFDPAPFECAQEHRESGKVRQRVAQDAECEVRAVEPFDEPIDHFGRTAHEQRLIGDQPAQYRDALALEEQDQIGRCQHRHRPAHPAQRFARAEGEEIGVARPESDDAQHDDTALRRREARSWRERARLTPGPAARPEQRRRAAEPERRREQYP